MRHFACKQEKEYTYKLKKKKNTKKNTTQKGGTGYSKQNRNHPIISTKPETNQNHGGSIVKTENN